MLNVFLIVAALIFGALILLVSCTLEAEEKELRRYLGRPQHVWDYEHITNTRIDIAWLQLLLFVAVTSFLGCVFTLVAMVFFV